MNGNGTNSVNPPVSSWIRASSRRWATQWCGASTWPYIIVEDERSPTRCAVVITSTHLSAGSLPLVKIQRISSSRISAAVPGLTASPGDGGLGLTTEQVGYILGSLKVAYGLGQGLNGQLAEYFSARRLLALGMLGSATLNVLFGLGTGFYFLLFVWACNGYCQSLGWTPCMRVAANWFPVQRRGRAIGVLGTSYQATAALTYVVAGTAAQLFGWRGAFYVPAVLLTLAALHMLLFLRESPDDPVRCYAIRLLTDRLPVSAATSEALVQAAQQDASSAVRLRLASAMQRLDDEPRWKIAEALALRSEDAAEGMRSFVERREAVFKGR